MGGASLLSRSGWLGRGDFSSNWVLFLQFCTPMSDCTLHGARLHGCTAPRRSGRGGSRIRSLSPPLTPPCTAQAHDMYMYMCMYMSCACACTCTCTCTCTCVCVALHTSLHPTHVSPRPDKPARVHSSSCTLFTPPGCKRPAQRGAQLSHSHTSPEGDAHQT